ncbi:D-ribitol-5-phosphate cytidylyltransferase-like [Argiope bruennichi]|uniref:2-C-methyl-D-erythritol 4-phosphate cytidylyltransferase, chloroplastic n=1 Tax=Argiope bruennichi TaxID=94029 RepID=A0A8T0E115_ARGBR|nr:D-ribitol-5-phosphate cytidylyltransferase-like [Argiope bruennichi]XP_055946610.1 D-ribitol-5-phosphate cytidylyltransferase-like [Argiope bruennichi]KAF8764046.1 D-ribitol-5-phosphate cytidylyltransferase like protein [Argiope bruennichi]
MAEGLVQCSLCSKTYLMNKNLYQHMRTVHNVSPQLKGKILCPLNCEESFRSHKDFRKHLETFHKYMLENEMQDFANLEMFETWKKSYEETSGYKYVCHSSEKILKTGEGKTYFFCHRSGVSKSDTTGLKSPRRCLSQKIGKTCPSAMEVSRSLADGTVKVDFWKTHIGHTAEPEFATPCKKSKTKKLEKIDFEVCAILPAAGSGERMGLDTPKQYISIHQKPIICHTVDAFLRIPFFKKVIVVAAPDCVDVMLQTLSEMCKLEGDKLMITEGSNARHLSILSGLKALKSYCEVQPEVVVVHDGVRPFFPEDIVSKVVHAAKEYGAAGVTCPLVSTVISVDDKGFLDTSLDRNKFRASEMPQAFQFDVLNKAYTESTANDLEHGTECLHLVQKYANVRAKLLPVSSHLWKVTHHKDIYTAAGVLKESQTVAVICKEQTSEFVTLLKNVLGKTFKFVHSVAKFNVSILGKFPNIVQVHETENPYCVIEKMSSFQKVSDLTSIVHVFINSFDPTINFLEFQKQAKISAKVLKLANILVYFIVREETEPMDSIEEMVDLVKSLLFESNPHASGNVFLS